MKNKFLVLNVLLLSCLGLSCAKKEKTTEKPAPTMEKPAASMEEPQVQIPAEGIDELYINYMVDQAKLSQEYVRKTSPQDKMEYEKKAQAIREKYHLDQHPDFREYYANLPPEKQMAFMQKMNQAMGKLQLKNK